MGIPAKNKLSPVTPAEIKKAFPIMVYVGRTAAILLVLIVGASSLYYSGRQREKEKWIEHAYSVYNKVDTVGDLLNEISLSRNRYVNTKSIGFLKEYNANIIYLQAQLKILADMVKDNPGQTKRVANLSNDLNNLAQDWKSGQLLLKPQKDRSTAQIVFLEKAKMDVAIADINAIKQAEQKLLVTREAENRQLRERTEIAIISGTVMILIIVYFLIWFIWREFNNRVKTYQQEKEISELKTNFVSIASHEFRTPLSSMMLSLSLIDKYARNNDADGVLKHSHKIKTAVNNLTAILEDFLSLEKLNTGKVRVKNEHFDLKELCESIIEDMELSLKPHQKLLYNPSETSIIVDLDKHLVHNAIVNLISNSIKYAGDQATILLETRYTGDRIFISVKDNGIGIAEDDQKNLFTAFYRVNNTGNIPGTGLGLNIVLRYVKLMNGKLSFSSMPGKETRFEMIFSDGKPM
ncbi:sensor histidine kinase [Mucilaginibacter gotjawali]|uniref:histidine kinase n=2 Tax=Mucilaginibacter gotjawali TaxID=1550579 RepID=A0A0X8X3R7_9SPHI|nr:ATP-binding protein [Mucilaginibacter gotjawali]MBB3056374.1 signal transduction histidine kinase [Mucilaginibacter gotjawali]BAU55081.1 Sensor histidine kinase RcsC [Mucilaginibacter gotjawali]